MRLSIIGRDTLGIERGEEQALNTRHSRHPRHGDPREKDKSP